MGKTSISKGVLAIVTASFLWGTTGTAAQYAPNISPLAIGAFAMGVCGLLLCCFAFNQLKNDVAKLRLHPLILLVGSLCVAIYPLAFYSSMRMSGVAIGTIVSIASAPLFAAALEFVFENKRVSFKWTASFVFGVLGVTLLMLGKSSSIRSDNINVAHYIGVLLGLVAGLTYAGYTFSAKRLIQSGVHSTSSMAGLFGCAALLLLPSLYFTGAHLFATPLNTTVALYMALVPMFGGYVLFGYGLRTVEASRATLITLLEPLVATLLAIYLVGETFRAVGWLGMGLVCLCMMIQSLPQRWPQRGFFASKAGGVLFWKSVKSRTR
ncbi:DMT family transporter [Alteromonas sp. D210916BOD_24]|uniref:DMT family transporter n=1 Tax=Alteromonas sp. D210916BOD_24 TaxID=3157618 RepID=UPI00399CB012